MELAGRENEILRVLEAVWKTRLSTILVGGYAVSALARHRFSVDCDLVLKEHSVARMMSVLQPLGFSEGQRRSGFDKRYGGRFVRFVKRVAGLPVSVDLLVNSLVCRDTDGSWSHEHILSHSAEVNIPGLQSSVKFRVPSGELLLTFKLHSARKADVRDIVMLDEDADWEEVARHVNRGEPAKLRTSLDRVLQSLGDPRLVDSLKGAFSIQGQVESGIRKTRKHVENIAAKLENDRGEEFTSGSRKE